MNNGESIKKYNDILIKYLNDLVNSIENNELNNMMFEDTANRLKNQLSEYNLDIAANGVKTMMGNAFKEYSSILKKHFDGSDIHRIDLAHSNDENLSLEMSQVTSNLANAVTNMNKIPEYYDLINRIKSTLTGFFSQNYSNYKDVEFEVEQILNEVITGTFTTYTSNKIVDFTRDILPELYTIGDSIVYEQTVKETHDTGINILDERDAFISETMDIDIHEDIENGVVTLTTTDSLGNTTKLVGKAAMEKLASYNALFESSRPGKIVDTSHWPTSIDEAPVGMHHPNSDSFYDVSADNKLVDNDDVRDAGNDDIRSKLLDGHMDNSNIANDNNDNNMTNITNNPVDDFNNLTMPATDNNTNMINNLGDEFNAVVPQDDFLETMKQPERKESNVNPVDEFSQYTVNKNININSTPSMSEFNILTTPSNDFNGNGTLDVTKIEKDDSFSNDLYNLSNQFNIDSDSINNSIAVNKAPTNNFVGTEFNNINEHKDLDNVVEENPDNAEDLKEVKKMMGVEERPRSSFDDSFSFLTQYDNPNQDRDDFIKSATGIIIEEDIDNQGDLYLKVTEPTGREQIYTGKEAVRMIKNFNKTYIDANPDKTVDTSLIDNFKEE